MGNKRKGSNAERELIHAFWRNDWAASRVAGSGSMRYPSPDIIASKNGKHLIVECKTTKQKYKYFPKEEIQQLMEYAGIAGMQAMVALRFPRTDWIFLGPKKLAETENSYVATIEQAKKHGKTFEEIK